MPPPAGRLRTLMPSDQLSLSVLDLVPVHHGQTTADALAASLALARLADSLGYVRYWFAEHHNMASVASTSPAVLIALVAAQTDHIRVGSGGVMLPNHAPFVVAEQFAALEAAAPGRIDLGIGRAPGSDQVISALLHQSGATSDVDRFSSHVTEILAMVGREGAQLNLRNGQTYAVRATPVAAGRPDVWLLGSSDYSAALAAQLGLPYVFAHHFSGEGTERALELYRANFRASAWLEAPRTFLTLNVVVADTAEEAELRALPNLHQMSRLRTGKPLTTLPLVEQAAEELLDDAQRRLVEVMRERWVIGDPATAAAQVRALAGRFGVDEVMVSAVAGARRDEPADRTPARERTLELLAKELL
jgi:luciferase family oxidoreductase group 1